MFKKLFLSVVVCLLSVNTVLAQEWKSTEPADYHSSVVKISGDGYSGSGTVIKFIEDSKKNEGYYIGYILTASHVVKSRDTLFTVYFLNGAITKNNTVVHKSSISSGFDDIALIRALIPDSIKPMETSTKPVPVQAEVEMCGYGTGQLRHWKAQYGGSVYDDGGHVIFSWAIQGDSGGPIIYNGKVVGVICFGMGIKKYEDTRRMIVGPIYGSNIGKLKYKESEGMKIERNGGTVRSTRKELYKNVTG